MSAHLRLISPRQADTLVAELDAWRDDATRVRARVQDAEQVERSRAWETNALAAAYAYAAARRKAAGR